MRRAVASLTATLLAACGDSGFSPVVTEVRVQTLQYGQPARILVTGANLSYSMTIDTGPSCTSPVYASSSTPSLAVITCQVTAVGDLPLALRSDSGKTLHQATLNVPLPQAQVVTNRGNITLELDPSKAPITVDNFLGYVSSGFYSNTVFHRVIAGFVIQGGGFAGSFNDGLSLKEGLKDPIPLESDQGLSNLRGTVAMARTNDPNSATSQFYINLSDNLSLDRRDDANPGYAVFGKVVSGLDVVDAIAATTTGTASGLSDVPDQDITITRVTRLR